MESIKNVKLIIDTFLQILVHNILSNFLPDDQSNNIGIVGMDSSVDSGNARQIGNVSP